MLISNRIRLRAIEESDLTAIAQWRSDPTVYEYFYEWLPVSACQQRAWYERQLSDPSEINLVVARSEDNVAIGTVSIYHIDRRSRKAEWGRLVIGDPAMRSGGIGSEIETMVLQYAFEHMGLNKLYCEILAANENVISLHEKFGFVREGVLRQHTFKRGSFVDAVVMSMLDGEYYESKSSGRVGAILERMSAGKIGE